MIVIVNISSITCMIYNSVVIVNKLQINQVNDEIYYSYLKLLLIGLY